MIRISQEQMALLDKLYFLRRLRQFISERCRNPRLHDWMAAQAPDYPAWGALWPQVKGLSEHDCALVLVFLATCQCEGKAAGPVELLIEHLGQHELGMKQFLSERAYCHFSDFEFSAPTTPKRAE